MPPKALKQASEKPGEKNDEWVDMPLIGIEMIVLYSATAANDYLSVTLYTDRDAEAKGKPLNSRANGIVVACGIKKKLIHGDAFLARTFDSTQSPWSVS